MSLSTHIRARCGFATSWKPLRPAVVGYPGDGANRWSAVHARDLAALFRLALEKAPASKNWHAVADEGVPFHEIAEAIGGRPAHRAHPRRRPDAAGILRVLANLVTLDVPTSSLITRQTLGWEPAQPGLIADMENGHYFPAS